MVESHRSESPARLNPWLARAVLVAGGVVVSAAGAELTLRVLGVGYGSVHMASSAVLHHEHPRDYRFLSYHPSREYGGHAVFYDELGRRADPAGSPDHDLHEVTVAVMGDSFVEALQVAHEDSFVGRLQRASAAHVTVHNYGTSSYCPALYLLQWRNRVRQQAPTHVFLMLFGNDVRDDAAMTAIAQFDAQGEIVAVSGAEPTLFARLARMTYLGRLLRKVQLQLEWMWDHRHADATRPRYGFVEENPEISELTDGYLRRLVSDVREFGAQLVLMAVPSRDRVVQSEPSRPGRRFHEVVREWAARHGVPFLDLSTPFAVAADAGTQLFFDRDIHFTAEGHDVVARTLLANYPEVFFGTAIDADRIGTR